MSPRSASGNRTTDTPNPRPSANPNIDSANARAPSGASSIATIDATTNVEFTNARARICDAVNTSKLGASAAPAFATAIPANPTSTSLRRPYRSASAAATNATRIPARVSANANPKA